MKKIFKKSILILLGFILGSVACISIGVYAYSYAATDIQYSGTTSVKQAIDDLYTKVTLYGFGTPTNPDITAITYSDGTTRAKTFIRLKNGEYSVCVYSDLLLLDCFRNNNYTREKTHFSNVMKSVSNVPNGDVIGYIDNNSQICVLSNSGGVYCQLLNAKCEVTSSNATSCTMS